MILLHRCRTTSGLGAVAVLGLLLVLLLLSSSKVVQLVGGTSFEDRVDEGGGGDSSSSYNYYLVGTGIHDMTGPAAQINFMGYAKASQNAHGIHQRLYARAYIVAEQPHQQQHGSEDDDDATSSTSTSSILREELEESSSSMTRESRETTSTTWFPWRRSRRRQSPPLLSSSSSPKKNTPASSTAADPDKTICFVSIDAGMGSDLLNVRVLKRLEELLPPIEEEESTETIEDSSKSGENNKTKKSKRKRLCHLENLSISGTHTHSAPGGFLQYALYQITSLGFSQEVMSIYVEGIAQAIYRAYTNLEPGIIRTSQDLLFDANINRSPTSYLLNPEKERNEYALVEGGDTDKRMLQLTFTAVKDNEHRPLGVLNWYAVHGTSLNSSNVLISGDNKGYASYLMEKHFNNIENNMTKNGNKNNHTANNNTNSFVAAFASTNLGDVSPNIDGPRCIDTGLPCDLYTSTCGDDGGGKNKTGLCRASGPGTNMFESTEIIGRRQYDMALRLFEMANNNNDNIIQGDVGFRHSFVDMSTLNVTLPNGDLVRTCPAALGYSFAGGTTDGPGDFDFSQGMTNTSNPFWNMIGGFLSIPTQEQVSCQFPKPILLNTGRANIPYDWDPNTVPISIFQVGQLFILNVPAEFTTMAGRRLRKAVKEVIVAGGMVQDPIITIAGLANSYTHYVTTIEEYAGQRYEAASTLYGPHTLSAYIQEFQSIASDLVEGRPSSTGKSPRDLSRYQFSFIPPIGFDTIGLGYSFGSVAIDPKDSYVRGEDAVMVSFRSANPRNNPRIEGTFLTVDMLDDNDNWVTKYTDGDWSTKFYWRGGLSKWGSSFAEIYWEIPADEPRGLYRVCHYGSRTTLLGYAESALYHTPGWLKSNMFGSFAASIMLEVVELAITLSDYLQSLVSKINVGGSRLRDFQGCSRAFLVHGNKSGVSNDSL